MYLGHYAFDGDPTLLEAAYRRLMAMTPTDNLELHVVVVRPDGLDIYDSCPDEATFTAFTSSSEFADSVAASGLPEPRITGLGEVVSASVRQPVG
jgi:hypothetical protein